MRSRFNFEYKTQVFCAVCLKKNFIIKEKPDPNNRQPSPQNNK